MTALHNPVCSCDTVMFPEKMKGRRRELRGEESVMNAEMAKVNVFK